MDEEPMEATAEELVHHHHQQQQHVGPTRMVARGQEMAGGPQLTSSSIGDEKQGLMPSSQHPHHHQHPHNHPCQSPDDETTTNQSVNQRNPTTTTITNNSNLTPTSPTTNIQQADPNGSQDSRKSTGVPLLRPGNMVMMTITQEDYETQYLPQLMDAINQLLTITPGTYIPISYEQMYSCVYKCVCKQFSERLYTDLINHIRSHLSQIDSHLRECQNDSTAFVEQFSLLMNQYLQALTGIVPIFNYMNRFYVETKLKTDLNDELRKLFSEIVVKQHISTLLTLLEEALSVPFTISPPVMASIIKNLYSLNPDYAQMKPDVFARYIPNIRPPTSIMGLEDYKAEARQMQQELLHNPEFNCSDSSRKRRSEEEIPRCGQPSH